MRIRIAAPEFDNPVARVVHRIATGDAADVDEALGRLDHAAPVTEAGDALLAMLEHYDVGPPRHVWAEGLAQSMADAALQGASAVQRGTGRSVPMMTALDDYAASVAASWAKTTAGELANAYRGLRDDAHATIGDLHAALASGSLDPERVARRAQLAADHAFATAYNVGAFDAVRQTGQFHTKTWNHDGDPITPRDWHEAMDGETVDIDEPFSNGIMFPCDPDGPPEETYNCTCSVTYSDEEGAG